MHIQYLRYLIALERERHFARAASACQVSQPTLSEGIKHLEQELGIPIVERGNRYQGLTPAGQCVLGWAQQIVRNYESMDQDVRALREGLVGRLTIGAIPATHPIVPIVTAPMLRAHPGVTVTVMSHTAAEIQHGLDDFSVDVGVTYLDNEPLSRVRAQALYQERYLLVTSDDRVFAGRDTITWREAAELPLCLLTNAMQNRRILDSVFREVGATVAPRLESTSLLTICAQVQLGGMSSILPHGFASLVSGMPGVRTFPLIQPEVSRTIGLVVADRYPLPPLARALMDLARTIEVDQTMIALGTLLTS